jgi:putative transposase
LTGDIGKSVREIIKQLREWKKVEILAGNVQIDHIHLVLWIPPKYSVSEFVGFLKGKSAIKIFDMHLELKRRYWGRHFWAKGYCVSTVGLDEDQIRKYVRWQLKKDRTIEQLELWKR